jgi:hypothetical protein
MLLVCLAATTAYATEGDIAVVHALPTAWLNGSLVPGISAIFPGDLVQTKTDPADINAAGSKILLFKDSLVKYRQGAVEVQRGGISVLTSTRIAAHVGDLKIQPSTADWTKFDVVFSGDVARIVATQGNLTLADEKGVTVLNAGQEVTRPIDSKRRKKAAGALPAAKGSVMDSPAAIIVGAGTITGVTAWVLLHDDDPISPDKP